MAKEQTLYGKTSLKHAESKGNPHETKASEIVGLKDIVQEEVESLSRSELFCYDSNKIADNGLAIGVKASENKGNAQSTGNGAIALGYSAIANKQHNLALGYWACATGEQSIQIGHGENKQPNSINFGGGTDIPPCKYDSISLNNQTIIELDGITIQSSNGYRFKIMVDDNGNLFTKKV